MPTTNIEVELVIEATAELKEQVAKELEENKNNLDEDVDLKIYKI